MAANLAVTATKQLGDEDYMISNHAQEILERLATTPQQNNLHLTMYGGHRLGPPPLVQPIKACTPRDGLEIVGLSPMSLTEIRDLKIGTPK